MLPSHLSLMHLPLLTLHLPLLAFSSINTITIVHNILADLQLNPSPFPAFFLVYVP
jgi:hypothetical protein